MISLITAEVQKEYGYLIFLWCSVLSTSSEHRLRMSQSRVVVVGAGAAGVAAACRLLSKGLKNVTLLEAQDRIGGRVHTVPFGEGCIDIGAQWVHGERGNVVFEMAYSLGMLVDSEASFGEVACVLPSGAQLPAETSERLFSICQELAYSDELAAWDKPVGDFFASRYREAVSDLNIPWNLTKSFLNWYARFQSSIDGCDDWFETSGTSIAGYRECEGNQLISWANGGYSNVFDLLKRGVQMESKTELGKEVTEVLWDTGGEVHVNCRDGSTYTADHVILTVPLGVLKERATTLFQPPLPASKFNAIQGLDFGTVNKIFLSFPHRWWPAKCDGFSLLWDSEGNSSVNDDLGQTDWSRDVFGFYPVLSAPLVLVGWLVGPSARLMERYSDQQVLDTCHRLLTKFLSPAYEVPRPNNICRTKWHSNQFFRGSYSFRSLKTERMNASASQLAEPLTNKMGKQVVLFAGEATHDNHFSTVHGAIESGWREADRILSLYPKSQKSML